MINRRTKEATMFLVFIAWIPLGILSFLFSPVRTDIKLLIAAGASFLTMIIFFMKEGG